ncbi:hypothetical protein [Xenophilus sp. Marseille-Q4582]|uniref:hypothetical protein n=1 Tax=Xenophilus sp. Marseille-Q4582 TaxID=2866600 RepID=UPI001CE3BA70|nr:hypothetical protein [Xenophilus sp. Marseille-Q4582]
MIRLALAAAAMAVLAGCTSTRISQDLSSGVIGCPAREIQIVNEEATLSGTHTFEAVCKGKRHFCSYHTTTGMNCKPE